MRLRAGHRRSERGGRRRVRVLVLLTATAVLAGSVACAEDQPVRFHDALKLYEAGKYAEAYAAFEVLARSGTPAPGPPINC